MIRFSDVQVQQVDGFMDLTTWLEFLRRALKALDAIDRDLMVARGKGYGDKEFKLGRANQ